MPEYLSISKFYFIFVPSVAFISIGKFGEFRRKTPQFDLTNCRAKNHYWYLCFIATCYKFSFKRISVRLKKFFQPQTIALLIVIVIIGFFDFNLAFDQEKNVLFI